MQNLLENNIFFVDEINNLAKNDTNLLVGMSEEMYHEQISELVLEAINKKSKIILVAGPSSSGKTTTSKLIANELKKYDKNGIFVSLDDFFLNRDKTPKLPNGNYDFESLRALDIKYLNKFLNDLTENKCAYMPKYNFITGKREETYTKLTIDENSVLIIEGLHALNPTLISNHDSEVYKVYICVMSNFNLDQKTILNYTQVRLLRRLIRDYYTRGRNIEQTLETWNEVLDGEKVNIDPFKNEADYFVDSTHMYEPLLYAKYLMPLISENSQETLEIKTKLNNFEQIDKNVIPENSLLREFIQIL